MNHSTSRIERTLELQLARLVRGLEATRRTRSGSAAMDRAVYVLLDRLDDGARSAAQLVTDLHLDQSTISRQLAAASRQGLVDRVADPAGGRAGLIALTVRGRNALAEERSSRADRVRTLLAEWRAADRRELARLITKLNDSIDQRIDALLQS